MEFLLAASQRSVRLWVILAALPPLLQPKNKPMILSSQTLSCPKAFCSLIDETVAQTQRGSTGTVFFAQICYI